MTCRAVPTPRRWSTGDVAVTTLVVALCLLEAAGVLEAAVVLTAVGVTDVTGVGVSVGVADRISPLRSFARRLLRARSLNRSAGGMKALTLRRRYRICWERFSGSCQPTNASASTSFRWIQSAAG